MAERVVVLRHGDDPPDDRVYTWLERAGRNPVVVRPFAGEPLGEIDGSVTGLVVHGGPYNAAETPQHPFMLEEMRWIEDALRREVPLLGLCQGAQMIAHVMGAYAGEPGPDRPGRDLHEFGLYEVRPTRDGIAEGFLANPLHVCQSHFHEFEIPSGCIRLAENDAYPNQAMRAGPAAWAMQFHPEVVPAGFRRWQDRDWAPWGKSGVQTREEQNRLIARHDGAQEAWFLEFLAKVFPARPAR